MATRSNLVVVYGDTKLYIYRYWDGYPAENGADILKALRDPEVRGFNAANAFVRALLEMRDEPRAYANETVGRPVYEITNGVHGDIEWLYTINFDRNGDYEPRVSWCSRKPGDADGLKLGAGYQPISAFVALVNADRREANRRIAEMKASNPGNARYAEMGEYAEVE